MSVEISVIVNIISYIRYECSVSKLGVVMDQWGGWVVRIGRYGVFQSRYAFGKVSSVSLVGGRPVDMGIDIVTTGAICRDIDVAITSITNDIRYKVVQI